MARRLNVHWHLRSVMAAHDIWKTTDLIPLLGDRGVKLSSAQVYRLVTDKPERLSLKVLAALCDIFNCTPGDLIEPYLESAAGKKAVVHENKIAHIGQNLKPERARIVDPQ